MLNILNYKQFKEDISLARTAAEKDMTEMTPTHAAVDNFSLTISNLTQEWEKKDCEYLCVVYDMSHNIVFNLKHIRRVEGQR